MDGRIYVRAWQGGVLSGGFEKNPKPIFTEGRNQLEIQNMQEDWDHFGECCRSRVRGADGSRTSPPNPLSFVVSLVLLSKATYS